MTHYFDGTLLTYGWLSMLYLNKKLYAIIKKIFWKRFLMLPSCDLTSNRNWDWFLGL